MKVSITDFYVLTTFMDCLTSFVPDTIDSRYIAVPYNTVAPTAHNIRR